MKQLDLGVKHKFTLHLQQNTLQIPEHPGFLHRPFFSLYSGKWPNISVLTGLAGIFSAGPLLAFAL